MRFIAPVEKFTFAIRRDSENLPFIAGCDEENAVRAKSEIPDVFRFRIKKDGFFARLRNAIYLAVRRRGHIKHAFGVEGNGLRHEIGRRENGGGLACCAAFKAENFCGGSAGRIERTLRVNAQRPKIGGVRIGNKSEFWCQLQPAIAAHRYAMGSALKEIFIRGLPPRASVLGKERRSG